MAGLSEISIVVSTPEPTSIAGAYLMTKQLYYDGLAGRARLLFNQVESADQAAALQTKFGILTGKFLACKLASAGYVRKDNHLGNSVLKQQPLLQGADDSGAAGSDLLNIARRLRPAGKFQIETNTANITGGKSVAAYGDDKNREINI